MKHRAILLGLLVLLFISAINCEPRKRGGSFGGGWGWKSSSKSRSTSRPQTRTQTQTQTHGSQPGKIGWNVPSGNNAKPSAPVNDHVSKSSATQVHSGYPSNRRRYNTYGEKKYHHHQYSNKKDLRGYNTNPVNNYRSHQYPNKAGQTNYGHGQPYSPQGRPPPYSPPGTQPSYGSNPGYGQHGYPGYGGHSPNYGGQNYGGMGHGFSSTPGSGYNPTIGSAQPIVVQSQPYKPGIGQIAKEAFVFAGVNAAVNRLLPGGIYGHGGSVWGGSSGSAAPAGAVPGVTNTHITYNNYYNNGTNPDGTPIAAPGVAPGAAPVNAAAAPAMQNAPPPAAGAPAAAPAGDNANPAAAGSPPADNQNNGQSIQNIPSPSGYVISNDDMYKLSEDLYGKEKNNAYKDITMNLQGHKTDDSSTDDAASPLLTVKKEAFDLPTVQKVLALHDNYELDVRTKETVTSDERKEENEFLDAILETEVMQTAMKYLADKGYVTNDDYEFKDTLKRIWFSQFKRIDGEPSSSGFETVFLAEQFDSEIIGLHNWIYFAKQEEANKLNYLGYIKKADIGSNGAIVKLRLKLNDVLQPLTTVFIGTSPELEMALYTLCFYIRPNAVCPVSLGGTQFMIVANRVNYFGKDILVAAYPEI